MKLTTLDGPSPSSFLMKLTNANKVRVRQAARCAQRCFHSAFGLESLRTGESF